MKLVAWLIQVALVGATLDARTLIVPDQFPSIQAALDSALDTDTIFVRHGVYHEALIAPGISLVMIGDVQPDSLPFPYPVIDPSPVPNSDSLGCLRLIGPETALRNFVFLNGPEMFPHNPVGVGGIRATNGNLTLNNCWFDSTFVGMYFNGGRISLDSCVFRDNQLAALWTEFQRVVASNCQLSGHDCFAVVKCGDSSRFSQCEFAAPDGHLINSLGVGHSFDACVFGPYGPYPFAIIGASDFGGEFRECLFRDCQLQTSLIGIARRCDSPLVFAECLFQNNHAVGGTVVAGVTWGCSSGEGSAIPVVFERVRFVENRGRQRDGKCVDPGPGGVEIAESFFMGNEPADRPTVDLDSNLGTVRRSVFADNGFAIKSAISNDARFNYWGDSTGPYHPVLNPDGLGDEVSDSVNFEPWYSDTSFLIDAAREPEMLPSEFALSVYPNPFNSVATISLETPDAFVASVEVLNILGERVTELHRGPLNGHHEFALNADRLASGVYVVHVRDIVRHSVNFSQKILLIR